MVPPWNSEIEIEIWFLLGLFEETRIAVKDLCEFMSGVFIILASKPIAAPLGFSDHGVLIGSRYDVCL